ncbi:uncharacterized protein [Dysidea avara]|uniref:uncharacterized protein isoform X1 n=1 Tax=Dysidea avara TaxID=196820 RepID=UPI00332CD860
MNSVKNSRESSDSTLLSTWSQIVSSHSSVDHASDASETTESSAMRRLEAEGDVCGFDHDVAGGDGRYYDAEDNVWSLDDSSVAVGDRILDAESNIPGFVNQDHSVMEDETMLSNDAEGYAQSLMCHTGKDHKLLDTEADILSLPNTNIDVNITISSGPTKCVEGKTTNSSDSQSLNSTSFHRAVGSSSKPWNGYNCCVPGCYNSSGKNKFRDESSKVSFHNLPDVKSKKGKTWIGLIHHDLNEDFVVTKSTKICSDHFLSTDFLLNCERRRLKPDAVPSCFPWRKCFKCRSRTSQKASQALLEDEKPNERMASATNSRKKMKAEIVSVSMDSTYIQPSAETAEEPDQQDVIVNLQTQVISLQNQLAETENRLKKSLFRLENIRDDAKLMKFYTGFVDYETLMAFYEMLESDALVMRQWSGRRCGSNYDDVKTGPKYKLPLKEQFFLTLVRLRAGLPELDVANRFDVSQATVSRITNTWINLMFHTLKSIEKFPPWHVVKKYMPDSFKKEYPNTRIIIDATEFAVERPSSLLSQACTFSAYKNKNTIKVLIGVTPSGAISFVSEAYEGSISDRKLVEVSGLLDKLEPGDEVMADKGFTIHDLLIPRGVRLNIPPFLQGKVQMTPNDVFLTKKIAHLRVHVERSIGRVKEFKILQDTLPATM